MLRQVAFLLAIGCFLLILVLAVLSLRPVSSATIHFREGGELSGEIIARTDRYIIVKADSGGVEQLFTWDQVRVITGPEPVYARQLTDFAAFVEFIAKLGVLFGIGVVLLGIQQYNEAQKWKREEFLADTMRDFNSKESVLASKQMIELLRYSPEGRKIRLYPNSDKLHQVTVAGIARALDTSSRSDLSPDEFRIRECFDAFFTRLERFEHYIESNLVTPESVYVYLYYWIDTLNDEDGAEETATQHPAAPKSATEPRALPGGKRVGNRSAPKLDPGHRQLLLNYIEYYNFPGLIRLLDRFKKRGRLADRFTARVTQMLHIRPAVQRYSR